MRDDRRWGLGALLALSVLSASVLASQSVASTKARSAWEGVYPAGQADRGSVVYLRSCSRCHGDDLRGNEGAEYPALTGDEFLEQWNDEPVATLVERIRTGMPFDRPGSLTVPQSVDLVAYLLSASGFPAAAIELPPDMNVLKQVLVTRVPREPRLFAQGAGPNSYPNPYRLDEAWAPLTAAAPQPAAWPERQVVGITFDTSGNLVLLQRADPAFLVLDASGQKIIRSWGDGLFVEPHAAFFMADGSVWVADVSIKDGKGAQVHKFGPDGRLLLTLGTKGVTGATAEAFLGPTGVVVSPKGDVFVSDGHRGGIGHRVVKFSSDGRFMKSWGTSGSAPGDFNVPHAIAIDSLGRLFVADRGNNRIQIFDQDGGLLDQWKQFGRPETILITSDDTIYVSDTQSNSRSNPGVRRGIRIGSARDGTVRYFIPDPEPNPDGVQTSAAVALGVDARGDLYTAEVWSNANVGMTKMVRRYSKP